MFKYVSLVGLCLLLSAASCETKEQLAHRIPEKAQNILIQLKNPITRLEKSEELLGVQRLMGFYGIEAHALSAELDRLISQMKAESAIDSKQLLESCSENELHRYAQMLDKLSEALELLHNL